MDSGAFGKVVVVVVSLSTGPIFKKKIFYYSLRHKNTVFIR